MLFKLVEPLKDLVNHVFALRVVEAEPELNPLGLWHGMERCRGPTSEGTSKCALLGMTRRTSPLVSALVDQADLGSDTRRVKRLPSPQAVSGPAATAATKTGETRYSANGCSNHLRISGDS